MKVGTNLMAIQTSGALNYINKQMSKSSERLSSGVRLNSAADGSAAVAIASKMKIKHVGVERANINTADATSLVQTAEGAISQIRDIVQRVRELVVQSGNDTLSDDDRLKIQNEINHYKEEIDGISKRTEFNKIKILSGEADNICTPDNNMRLIKASDTVNPGEYSFTLPLTDTLDPLPLNSISSTAEYTLVDNILTITDIDNQKIVLDISNSSAGESKLTIESRGLIFQVGSDKSMESHIVIPKINSATLELNDINVLSWQEADKALDTCSTAITELTRFSARLGAYMNRLEYTQSNLETTSLNLEESLSRITDTDMAKEMIAYTRAQILAQADISMLAQANQRPQQLLQLFQR